MGGGELDSKKYVRLQNNEQTHERDGLTLRFLRDWILILFLSGEVVAQVEVFPGRTGMLKSQVGSEAQSSHCF